MTKSRGINRQRWRWTRAQVAILKRRYPHERTANIAADNGCSTARIYVKAKLLGLHKTAVFLDGPDSGRLRFRSHIGAAYRFRPGQVPANKGLRRPGWARGRMRETQFKKGRLPHNSHPDFYVLGALRVNTDGYIDMRISFDIGALGWRTLHRILWEDAHGPVPKGYKLRFKDGDKLNVCLENLYLLSDAEHMRRCTIARFPPALRAAIRLARKTERAIREQEHR
jgi:hypothetical protein